VETSDNVVFSDRLRLRNNHLPINDTEQLSSLVKTHQCVWIRAVVATASCQDVAGHTVRAHAPGMFVVREAEAAAIRTAFEQRGELSAAVELRDASPASSTTRRQWNAPAPSPAGNRCAR
jgi:hypothetical protein